MSQSFSITKLTDYFLELRETIVAVIDNAERLGYVEELPMGFAQQTVSNNDIILCSFNHDQNYVFNEFWIIYRGK